MPAPGSTLNQEVLPQLAPGGAGSWSSNSLTACTFQSSLGAHHKDFHYVLGAVLSV